MPRELELQIAALKKLHEQVKEATLSMPYYPQIENIRIVNMRDSRSRETMGAIAHGTVKMRFHATVVPLAEDDKI